MCKIRAELIEARQDLVLLEAGAQFKAIIEITIAY